MIATLPRWTEEELLSDIERIDARLETTTCRDDERSRCAKSYLQQLLRDRKSALAVLRCDGGGRNWLVSG